MVKMWRGKDADEGGHQRDQHEDKKDEPEKKLILSRKEFTSYLVFNNIQTYQESQISQTILVC